MKNLHDCFPRKKQLTASTKNKKRDAGLSDCEAKCGILLCCTADMESGERPEKEATAAKINLRAIIKMKLGGCPLFAILAKQEYISTHKVKTQLVIEDDILRIWGMSF